VRIGGISRRKPRNARRREDVILFGVAGNVFAIAARAVEKIESAEGMRALRLRSGRPAKVRHTLAHRSKTYYVVDGNVHLALLPTRPTRVLLLRGTRLALSVDSIDRMAEITALHTLPRAFSGLERSWYRGLAVMEGSVVPVIDPGALLSAQELAALEAESRESEEEAKRSA
jgi:chemotaxis signal transduction protein